MDFKEAESKYFELKGRLDSGVLSASEFNSEVARLRVQDERGQYWTIDAASGGWLQYDGTEWVSARAPGGFPPATRPPSRTARPRQGRRSPVLLIGALAVAALLCLVALGGAGIILTRPGGDTGGAEENAAVSREEAERIADGLVADQFPDLKDAEKSVGSYENPAGTGFWTITYREDDQAELEGVTYEIPNIVIVSVDKDTGEAIAAISG
jgi:hypothetical protein